LRIDLVLDQLVLVNQLVEIDIFLFVFLFL